MAPILGAERDVDLFTHVPYDPEPTPKGCRSSSVVADPLAARRERLVRRDMTERQIVRALRGPRIGCSQRLVQHHALPALRQMPVDVMAQLTRGVVAALGLLPERLENDGVQVTGQEPGKLQRIRPPSL